MAEIHFQLTRKDYDRLSQRVAQHWPRRLRWLCMSPNVFSGLGFGLMAVLVWHARHWLGGVGFYLGAAALFAWVLGFALQLMVPRVLANGVWRPDGDILSPQTLDFDAHGLRIQSGRVQASLPWEKVLMRDEDSHNVYLFIDATQAFVLPKAALAPVWADFQPLLQRVPTQMPALPQQA